MAGEILEGTPEELQALTRSPGRIAELIQQAGPAAQLATLAEPFHGSDVKSRTQQGTQLDYVPIDAVIRRYLEAAPDYQHDVEMVKVEVGPNTTSSGKPMYIAVAKATIVAFGVARGGLGAGENHDLDTAVKTADAEAFKKAANKFGTALELWDPTARGKVALWRKAAGGDENALKQYVFALAADLTGEKPKTKAAVAKAFGMKEAELNDVAVLRKIAGIG